MDRLCSGRSGFGMGVKSAVSSSSCSCSSIGARRARALASGSSVLQKRSLGGVKGGSVSLPLSSKGYHHHHHLSSSSSARVVSVRSSSKYVFDPDNSSILVAGGGGVGIMVTRMLKDMGAWVWMLQRTDERREEIENMMAIVTNGDARNKEDVTRVFEEIDDLDAVVSTIGGSPADPSSDGMGNINLIEAAAAAGVKRFVLVTSIGTGDSKNAPPSQVYEVLKPCLEEKEKAEERLKALADKMDFVIVRPGGLKSEPKTNTGVLTTDVSVCGPIHREDVASLVCKCLFSSEATNKVYHAVDKEQTAAEKEYEITTL